MRRQTGWRRRFKARGAVRVLSSTKQLMVTRVYEYWTGWEGWSWGASLYVLWRLSALLFSWVLVVLFCIPRICSRQKDLLHVSTRPDHQGYLLMIKLAGQVRLLTSTAHNPRFILGACSTQAESLVCPGLPSGRPSLQLAAGAILHTSSACTASSAQPAAKAGLCRPLPACLTRPDVDRSSLVHADQHLTHASRFVSWSLLNTG